MSRIIYLPDRHGRIADDLDVRMQDRREVQRSDLPLYLAATLISLALLALCWFLSNDSVQRHQAAIISNATNQATIWPAGSDTRLNFSHGDMPMLPVFSLKDARPLQ